MQCYHGKMSEILKRHWSNQATAEQAVWMRHPNINLIWVSLSHSAIGSEKAPDATMGPFCHLMSSSRSQKRQPVSKHLLEKASVAHLHRVSRFAKYKKRHILHVGRRKLRGTWTSGVKWCHSSVFLKCWFDPGVFYVNRTKLCQVMQWRQQCRDLLENQFENSSNRFKDLLRCNNFHVRYVNKCRRHLKSKVSCLLSQGRCQMCFILFCWVLSWVDFAWLIFETCYAFLLPKSYVTYCVCSTSIYSKSRWTGLLSFLSIQFYFNSCTSWCSSWQLHRPPQPPAASRWAAGLV